MTCPSDAMRPGLSRPAQPWTDLGPTSGTAQLCAYPDLPDLFAPRARIAVQGAANNTISIYSKQVGMVGQVGISQQRRGFRVSRPHESRSGRSVHVLMLGQLGLAASADSDRDSSQCRRYRKPGRRYRPVSGPPQDLLMRVRVPRKACMFCGLFLVPCGGEVFR
jgi:hypothetical protein